MLYVHLMQCYYRLVEWWCWVAQWEGRDWGQGRCWSASSYWPSCWPTGCRLASYWLPADWWSSDWQLSKAWAWEKHTACLLQPAELTAALHASNKDTYDVFLPSFWLTFLVVACQCVWVTILCIVSCVTNVCITTVLTSNTYANGRVTVARFAPRARCGGIAQSQGPERVRLVRLRLLCLAAIFRPHCMQQ